MTERKQTLGQQPESFRAQKPKSKALQEYDRIVAESHAMFQDVLERLRTDENFRAQLDEHTKAHDPKTRKQPKSPEMKEYDRIIDEARALREEALQRISSKRVKNENENEK